MKFVTFAFVMLFVFCWKPVFCEDTIPDAGEDHVKHDSQKTKETGIKIKITMPGFPQSNLVVKTTKSSKLVCPGPEASGHFFSIPCKSSKECSELGNKNMVCCNNRCLRGVTALPPEPVHSPTLFGLVERVCPSELVPEFLEIKQCTVDTDCSPRICCPEKMTTGVTVGYCRTAQPKLDRIPGIRQFMEPFRHMMSYLQCTPPPPPFLDIFPKECRNPLDCFPNLCCQERGKRYCRPPRRSLLTLLTTVAQRIVPTETARDIINRIAA